MMDGSARCAPPLDRCALAGRGIQVFGQWSGDDDVPLPGPTLQGRRLVQREPARPTWLQCSAFATEAQRVSATPLAQLEPSQIMGQGIQSSRLRWRLAWGGAGGGQERVLDIGAGSVVSVYACSTVAIEALIPEGAFVGRTDATLSGRVIDALVGAEILECSEAPVGSSRGRLTDEVQQGAGVTTVDVPPGALRVGIFGDAGDVVRWVVGPPNGDGTLATLATLTLGATGYVETEVPGLAQGLAFPAGQSRNVAVWRLDI